MASGLKTEIRQRGLTWRPKPKPPKPYNRDSPTGTLHLLRGKEHFKRRASIKYYVDGKLEP